MQLRIMCPFYRSWQRISLNENSNQNAQKYNIPNLLFILPDKLYMHNIFPLLIFMLHNYTKFWMASLVKEAWKHPLVNKGKSHHICLRKLQNYCKRCWTTHWKIFMDQKYILFRNWTVLYYFISSLKYLIDSAQS